MCASLYVKCFCGGLGCFHGPIEPGLILILPSSFQISSFPLQAPCHKFSNIYIATLSCNCCLFFRFQQLFNFNSRCLWLVS